MCRQQRWYWQFSFTLPDTFATFIFIAFRCSSVLLVFIFSFTSWTILIIWFKIIAIFVEKMIFLWCHFKWKTPWLWHRQRSHCSRLSCRICRELHHSEWSSSSIYSFHSEKHCSRTRKWKILYEFRCSISVEKLILATVRHSAPKPINSTTYIQSIQVNN